MASNEKYCLRWNDFETNISTAFRELREQKDFFDVTLACDDKQVQAHKVILSACSPFFRTVLRANPHQHPLLYLRGVKYSELVNVLNFMYQGEVNIAQEELTEFLSVADDLRVKGLAQGGGKSQGQAKSNLDTKDPPPHVNNGPSPSKRKRRSPSPVLPQCSTDFQEESDEIEEVTPQVKQEPILVTPSVMVDQDPIETSHDMVLEGNPQYEESYDGFQYDGDGAYDETSMMDSSMGDGNKGVYQSGLYQPITRKKKWTSLEVKMQIIDELEKPGATLRFVAEKFDIGRSTAHDIKKNKEYFRSEYEKSGQAGYYKQRK